MDEIKIYRSIWKNALWALLFFVFVIMGIVGMVKSHKLDWEIILCVSFFFIPLLFYLYRMMKRTPVIVITKQKIIYYGPKKVEFVFDDIESFTREVLWGSTLIGIKYKPQIEKLKSEGDGKAKSFLRNLNNKSFGYSESFPVDGLNVKSKKLLIILNEKLEKSR